MNRYKLTYSFFDDEESAKKFCELENKKGSRWKRLKHKAHYTPWRSLNGLENKFIAWYVW